MARRQGVPMLALMLLTALGSACASAKTTGLGTTSSASTTSTSPARPNPSAPLAAGSPVPGYRVGPLSFISASQGFGLYEFDTTGQSNAQQLVVTHDGGVTWQAASATVVPASASTLEFIDADTGYAWGIEGLDVTHDGGQLWSKALPVSNGPEAVSPIGTNIWAITSSGVLESSTDGGVSWQSTTQPAVPNPALLSRVTTKVAYVLGCGQTTEAGTEPGMLARTEDSGTTWQTVALPQGCTLGGAVWSDLVALSTDDLWLVQFGQPATDMSAKWVYRSSDGGGHWTLKASVVVGQASEETGHILSTGDVGPLSVLAAQPNRAWLAEDRGGLLVTTDGGLDWQPAYANPAVDALGAPMVSFLDPDHGWAATGYGLWRTTDGTDWIDIAPAPSDGPS